jgi:tetratricopeptide (TPR) repeat protein
MSATTNAVSLLAGLAVLALGLRGVEAAAPPARPRSLTAVEAWLVQVVQGQTNAAASAGRFEEAVRLARQVAALREKALGKRHWRLLDDRLEVERYERLVRAPQNVRPGVVAGRRCLVEGDRLRARRDHRGADRAYREALANLRQALGEDHPETALASSKVGLNLDAQGRHAEAQPLHEKALASYRKVLGEHHPLTATSGNHLGSNLHAQGRYARALLLFEKALAVRRTVLGDWHPDTAIGCTNVALTLNALGQHARARTLFEEALAIRRSMLGADHPHTASSCNNLASCLNDQGFYAQAQPLFEKALAINRAVLGEQHPDTATNYNLALNLDAQGQHARAQPLAEKALQLSRSVLGERHPDTAISYNNLAFNLDAQGKFAQAQPLYEKALAIWRAVLGEDHPHTATTFHNLASCLHAQKQYARAQSLAEKALAIRQKTLGENHPLTATSCHNLALCLADQARHPQAQLLFAKALAIRRAVLGEDHPETALGYHNLAASLHAQGKHAEALPLFQKALQLHRALLGEHHHLTAASYHHVAFNLSARGKHAEAAPYWGAAFRASAAARSFVAGSGFDHAIFHADHTPPGEALAVCLARLGEPALAWEYAEASLARGLLDDLQGSTPRDEQAWARLARLDALLVPMLGRALPPDQRRRRDDLHRQRAELLGALARQAADASARLVYPRERIQRQIPADAALVLWLQAGPEVWGCVLRRFGPPRWQRLPGRGQRGAWTGADLALPTRLHQALADHATTPGVRDQLAATLRQRLLAPLRPHLAAEGKLPAVRRLLAVPRGLLAGLPLEGIAADCSVSYVPSGTILARLLEQHRPVRARALLALGDPALSARLPDPPGHGLLVRLVLPGSNAARAGLRSGDVLLRHGKTALKSLRDLEAVSATGPAALAYWRNGREHATRASAGSLGAVFDDRPAPQAVMAWRQENTFLAQRGTGHPPLPATRWEVEALARLVSPTTTLLGARAGEAQLDELARSGKLVAFPLIHLATHGEVNLGRPELSALILAQDRLPDPLAFATRGHKARDGRLTVETIRTTWKLDADLVVLSACQTGLGRDTAEGLLGFAHALLGRGARSVVLSRWKVDDTATALLMVRFYENLLGKRGGLAKPLGRAAALAEAKAWLRALPRKELEPLAARLAVGTLRGTQKEALPVKAKAPPLPSGDRPFGHPYYWAAFVLVGDPD